MDDSDCVVGQIAAPALPRSPYPVDPYHFYCRNGVDTVALINDIRQLFVECDIEHTFRPLKCKFKCVKYVHYSHVEFYVRVYTSGDRLLLEFQRRTGSLLLWDGLYSVLYHRLMQWVDVTAAACPQSGAQKKVAPREEESISVRVWKKLCTSVRTPTSGVEAMKIMVSSTFADVQREGCAGLAVITEEPENAFRVAEAGIVQYLVQLAESEDFDMARSAIGALGNISRALPAFPDRKLAAVTLEQIKPVVRVAVLLLAHTTSSLFSLELLRECARALSSFGRVCPSEIRGCDGAMQLQQHANHQDHQLSSLCQQALQELQANAS
ncbi:hypothetical protein P43SY_005548 [Pythium insidiosum]|uniref:Uncharacterized protein n=1 Tax=Pythium insidiosum TaxID=114742 RepID=A0AAD5LKP1_PYTIN|nr:hypothetical protein P43SY_005548 [Pythium insidiosum]